MPPLLALMWGTEFLTTFKDFQKQIFEHPVISSFISLVLLPILLLGWKGKPGEVSVFKLENVRNALRFGGKTMSIMVPATFAFPIFSMFGWTYYDWKGGLVIAAA